MSMQIEDPDLSPIILALQSDTQPRSLEAQGWSPASRHCWLLWDSLILVDGLVVKRFKKQNAVETFYQLLTSQHGLQPFSANAMLQSSLGILA